jgi:hypothetical protein
VKSFDSILEVFGQEIATYFVKCATHMKFHSMLHVTQFYRLYGPLQMYDAEQPESENGTVRKFLQNSNRHNSTKDLSERFSVYENARSLLLGLWTIDNDGIPGAPGSALVSLLEHKEIQKDVVFKRRESSFMIKKNEHCWINDNLYRIITPRNPESVVQRLVPTGEIDSFGNRVFILAPNKQKKLTESIGDYAHVFHMCNDLCRVENDSVIHSDDTKFVLNAFRFKENDPGWLQRMLNILK